MSIYDEFDPYQPPAEPHLEQWPKPHQEAPPWLLTTFYWSVVVASLMGITAATGQIYTKMHCSTWKENAATGTTIFEVIAWATILICLVTLSFAIYALYRKMGHARVDQYISFDRERRIKEIDRELQMQGGDAVFLSPLPRPEEHPLYDVV